MAEERTKIAKLGTLGGIADAREELYNALQNGEITEARAGAMERILRGQQALKGELPLRFISMVTRYKGGKLEGYIAATVGELSGFLGTAPKELSE